MTSGRPEANPDYQLLVARGGSLKLTLIMSLIKSLTQWSPHVTMTMPSGFQVTMDRRGAGGKKKKKKERRKAKKKKKEDDTQRPAHAMQPVSSRNEHLYR